MESNSNRRKFSRVVLDTKVQVTFFDQESRRALLLDNLSEGGLFIRTDEIRAIGSKIHFEFALKDGGPTIMGSGIVRWIETGENKRKGLGIKFLELNEEGQREILEILKIYKKSPLG